jgi:MotA/TolQ/ExbB proton channel family
MPLPRFRRGTAKWQTRHFPVTPPNVHWPAAMIRTAHEGSRLPAKYGKNGDVSESIRKVVIPFSAEMIGGISRASARSAAIVHEDMRKGLDDLANIAYIAPWLGLFATVLTLPNSFGPVPGEKSLGLALCAAGLSRSILPTALGLLIGLVSLSFSKYLNATLEAFDREMECTSLDLLNQITRYRGRWIVGSPTKPAQIGPIFGTEPLAGLTRDPIP